MEKSEWSRILFNDLHAGFLLEVAFRCVVMFTVLLMALRFAGKRGVRQLSVFETVIIIALGSAAGDPMFYEDVGLLPAITVFICIIILYRFVTWLTGKSKWFEHLVEGKTECLIAEGKFTIDTFKREDLAQDEFFMELRLKSIAHLGQVQHAYIEPSGDISVFFYPDDAVKYGLPILPQLFCQKSITIPKAGMYSCAMCGFTQQLGPGIAVCPECKEGNEWVESLNTKRIA